MKHTLFLFCCLFAVSAFAQPIYITDTAFITGNGYHGAPSSSICTGCSWSGQSMDYADPFWLADDITVPAGATYKLDTVIVYGYERNSSRTSTFTAGYLRVYAGGAPGAGGHVIWGDSVTNILSSTSFTGIYRVPTPYSTDTSRPLMSLSLVLSPAPLLPGGTYWLAWAATGSGAHFVDGSFKVSPDKTNPANQNGLQYDGYTGVWEACSDGARYGMNFIAVARATTGLVETHKNAAIHLGNAPNPFTGSTNISFELAAASYCKLTVYNLLGQCVATLQDGIVAAGKHQVTFLADHMPTGIYRCQLFTTFGTDGIQIVLSGQGN